MVKVTVEFFDADGKRLRGAVATAEEALLSEPFAGSGPCAASMTKAKWVGQLAESAVDSLDRQEELDKAPKEG